MSRLEDTEVGIEAAIALVVLLLIVIAAFHFLGPAISQTYQNGLVLNNAG